MTFSGVDTSGTNGSGAIGAIARATRPSELRPRRLSTTRNGSWVFGSATTTTTRPSRTPGTGQTIVHQHLPSLAIRTGFSGAAARRRRRHERHHQRHGAHDRPLQPEHLRNSARANQRPTGRFRRPSSGGRGERCDGHAWRERSCWPRSPIASGNLTIAGVPDGDYTCHAPLRPASRLRQPIQQATVNGADVWGVLHCTTRADIQRLGTIAPVPAGSGATVTVFGPRWQPSSLRTRRATTRQRPARRHLYRDPAKNRLAFSPTNRAATVNGGPVTGVDLTRNR